MNEVPISLDILTAAIQAHEGFRSKPYTDTSGNITIGYGRNLSTVGVSYAEAVYLLGNDIQSAIRTAHAQFWWPAVAGNDARARAFIEIGFNIGFGGLATFSQALAAAMEGDWNACADQFRASRWASQVGDRADILTGMIETGKDP